MIISLGDRNHHIFTLKPIASGGMCEWSCRYKLLAPLLPCSYICLPESCKELDGRKRWGFAKDDVRIRTGLVSTANNCGVSNSCSNWTISFLIYLIFPVQFVYWTSGYMDEILCTSPWVKKKICSCSPMLKPSSNVFANIYQHAINCESVWKIMQSISVCHFYMQHSVGLSFGKGSIALSWS